MSEPVMIHMADRGPMLQAVGAAIHAFANIEFGLTSLLNVMLSSRLGTPILEAGRHFEVRMRIIEAVANEVLVEADLKTAKNLFNRARRRSDMRNKLAHWQVGLWPPAKTAAGIRKMRWMLLPPSSGTRLLELVENPKSEGISPIRKAEIEAYTDQCNTLANELFDFAMSLGNAGLAPARPAP